MHDYETYDLEFLKSQFLNKLFKSPSSGLCRNWLCLNNKLNNFLYTYIYIPSSLSHLTQKCEKINQKQFLIIKINKKYTISSQGFEALKNVYHVTNLDQKFLV